MWVWTEDKSAMVNVGQCFLIIIRPSDVGVGVMVHRDRGDMGTLIKICDSEEEAQRFVNSLGASLNGGPTVT